MSFSIDAFEAYLNALPEAATFKRQDGLSCPLAAWLKTQSTYAYVVTNEVLIRTGGEYAITSQPWMKTFVLGIDLRLDGDIQVTREEALGLLKEVRERYHLPTKAPQRCSHCDNHALVTCTHCQTPLCLAHIAHAEDSEVLCADCE